MIARALPLAALVLLAACAGKADPIIREVPVTVQVPVSVPCLSERPAAVTALIERIGREQWDALSTDQRANLLAAQAIERKVYGDKLTDAAAGCLAISAASQE